MAWLSSLITRNKAEPSANTARDRLSVVIKHQRLNTGSVRINDRILGKIQNEIFEVISRYLPVQLDKVNLNVLNIDNNQSRLEIDVPLAKEGDSE